MTQDYTSLQKTFVQMAHDGLILDVSTRYSKPHPTKPDEPLIPIFSIVFNPVKVRDEKIEHYAKTIRDGLHKTDSDSKVGYRIQGLPHGKRIDIKIQGNARTLTPWIKNMEQAIAQKSRETPLLGALRYKARLTDRRIEEFSELLDHYDIAPKEVMALLKLGIKDALIHCKRGVTTELIDRTAIYNEGAMVRGVVNTIDNHTTEVDLSQHEQALVEDVRNFLDYAEQHLSEKKDRRR